MSTPRPSSAGVPTPTRLSRRGLLRTGAVAGLGSALLAACGDSTPEPAASSTPTEIDAADEVVQAIRAAGFGELVPDWTVIVATFEVITGPGRRLQFGLLDETRAPTQDREVDVAIVRASDFEVVQTMSNPVFHGEGLGIRGVYALDTDLPKADIHYLIVAGDGHVGAAALRVIDPETSLVAQIGNAFPVVATPTLEDPQDLAELCTREPDCTMHDVSLETALAAGRPVVLTIATPKYCQTAVCGPVVDVVEDLKEEAPGDIAWIHAEVFIDAGNTPTKLVADLQLPSEPWTFLIGSDGTLVDRFDGPVVPALLREAVEKLA